MVMMVMAVPAVPVVMPVAIVIPPVAAMIPPVVAVPAAMAPVVMMAPRAVPAVMVATIGRLGDARAEQREKPHGGSNKSPHRLTFPHDRQRSRGGAYAMRCALALTLPLTRAPPSPASAGEGAEHSEAGEGPWRKTTARRFGWGRSGGVG